MCAARVKTVLPLAVHFGGPRSHWGEANISQQYPPTKLCAEGLQGDRQRKNFTKPVKRILVLWFLTSNLHLLSHINRLGISEIVDIHPPSHKIVPP